MRAVGKKTTMMAAAFVASSLVATSVRAEAPTKLELSWTAPSQCPQQGDFDALVERFLRQSLADRRQQRLSVSATVREASSGELQLRLLVKTAAGSQTRELSHRDCNELTEAGALVTALAIDPNLVVGDPAPSEPAEEAPAEPAAAIVTSPPAVPPPAPRAAVSSSPSVPESERERPVRGSSSWQSSLLALGLAGNAVLPGAGVGLGGRAATGLGPWRLAARGAYWLERFEPVTGGSGAGLALGAWSVGVRACGLPVLGRFSVWVCLGPDLGQLRAEGRELERARTARERWSSLNAELSLVHTASSGLMTQLGFELGKTLEAPRFGIRVDGREEQVFAANSWIAQAFVGFGFSFAKSK